MSSACVLELDMQGSVLPTELSAEQRDVLAYALNQLIELLRDPSSADRADNPEAADRMGAVAQDLLDEVQRGSEESLCRERPLASA